MGNFCPLTSEGFTQEMVQSFSFFFKNLFWVKSEEWSVGGQVEGQDGEQEDAAVSKVRWQFAQGQWWK